MSVCPIARNNSSRWTHIHQIWCLEIFLTFTYTFQIWLKSDNSNGRFMWRSTCASVRRSDFQSASVNPQPDWPTIRASLSQAGVIRKEKRSWFLRNKQNFLFHNLCCNRANTPKLWHYSHVYWLILHYTEVTNVVIELLVLLLRIRNVLFKSRPGDQLSWLRRFLVLLGPSRQMLRYYLKSGHDRFLP
jgi:hypothetical protein